MTTYSLYYDADDNTTPWVVAQSGQSGYGEEILPELSASDFGELSADMTDEALRAAAVALAPEWNETDLSTEEFANGLYIAMKHCHGMLNEEGES